MLVRNFGKAGMDVDVYININKNCVSIRNRSSGLVVEHTDECQVKDVEFVVEPGGRERVLKEKKKNVHAFVRGTLSDEGPPEGEGTEVTYNPYKYSDFVVRDTGEPIKEAEHVTVKMVEVDGEKKAKVLAYA